MDCTVRKTPVGIEWRVGDNIQSNMPKSVMIRNYRNDRYVKFDPRHDNIPEWSEGFVEVKDDAVYATIPSAMLADLPIVDRLGDNYETIANPTSGEYYIFINPVSVVFRTTQGDGFHVDYSKLLVLNANDEEVPYVSEMFEIPHGATVNLYMKPDGFVCIDNAFKYLKKPQSFSAVSLLANRLFGNESQQSLGAASIIIDEITTRHNPITAEQLADALSKFFDQATSGDFSGSPQGAYEQKKSLNTISRMLFGLAFAAYLTDKRITSVSWDQNNEMYIPYDGATDLYQEYAANYIDAEPVNVMDYLYSKIGDKTKFLPQASIDDCVTKADCDALIAMLSNFL